MKNYLNTSLKGFIIGIAMLIPGVSGGTAAILLNIYDKIISSMAEIFKFNQKNKKQPFLFLSSLAVGGLTGIVFAGDILSDIFVRYEMQAKTFFCVFSVFSIPELFRSSEIKKFRFGYLLFFISGLIPLLIGSFLLDRYVPLSELSSPSVVYITVSGIILSIALILPGISFSYMLVYFRLYGTTLTAIKELDIKYLSVFAFSILIGTVIFTSFFNYLLKKYKAECYFAVMGLLISSTAEIFPKNYFIFHTSEAIICTISAVSLIAAALYFIVFINKIKAKKDKCTQKTC